MSKVEINEDSVFIGKTEYVRKDSIQNLSIKTNTNGLKYVIVRTYTAGVFADFISRRESTLAGIEVTLLNARRIWKWNGAASLSQLAMEGTSKPLECKFPCEVSSIDLIAIEIIDTTTKCYESIKSVSIWKE